jgi:hypothetical protein
MKLENKSTNEELLFIAKCLKDRGLVKIRNYTTKKTFFGSKNKTEVFHTDVQLTKKGEKYLYDNWITDIKELFKIEEKEINKLKQIIL